MTTKRPPLEPYQHKAMADLFDALIEAVRSAECARAAEVRLRTEASEVIGSAKRETLYARANLYSGQRQELQRIARARRNDIIRLAITGTCAR